MADNWDPVIGDLLDRYFQAELDAHECKQASARYAEARKVAEAQMADAKAELSAMMREAGVMSDSHPRALLSLSKGRESVIYDDDFDVYALPIEYIKTERRPDATQIKAALARGEAIKGARLVRGADILKIKAKETVNG